MTSAAPISAGVPLPVKQDVLSNPVEVGLFGAVAIMACADEVTHLFEQLCHGEVSGKLQN